MPLSPPKQKPHFELDPSHTDPKRLKAEREKARELRKTSWWKQLISTGRCHYCEKKVPSSELTMDHIIPLARGGVSIRANLVPSCRPCNQAKKLETPLDRIFEQIDSEKSSEED